MIFKRCSSLHFYPFGEDFSNDTHTHEMKFAGSHATNSPGGSKRAEVHSPVNVVFRKRRAERATFDILWRIIDHMSADARISGLRQRDLLHSENANAAVKLLSRSPVYLTVHSPSRVDVETVLSRAPLPLFLPNTPVFLRMTNLIVDGVQFRRSQN